jgi:hypothetical protein
MVLFPIHFETVFLWQAYDFIAVTRPIDNICTTKTRHEITWTDISFPNSTLIIDPLVRTASKAAYFIIVNLHVASYKTSKISLLIVTQNPYCDMN